MERLRPGLGTGARRQSVTPPRSKLSHEQLLVHEPALGEEREATDENKFGALAEEDQNNEDEEKPDAEEAKTEKK